MFIYLYLSSDATSSELEKIIFIENFELYKYLSLSDAIQSELQVLILI